MTKLKILVAEPETCHKDYINLLRSIGDVEVKKMSRQMLLKEIKNYDILIIGVETRVDREVLDRAERLKIIGSHTTGVDHIDLDSAQQKNVKVVTLREAPREFLDNVTATAEHTMAIILSLIRKIPWAFDSVRKRKWQRSKFFGNQLSGKILGIIGYGRLGAKVAKYALAFDMKVIAFDPYIDPEKMRNDKVLPVEFDYLLQNSDIISLHVKLTTETENMISFDEFKKMVRKPLIVNTSRGRIINEDALLHALENGFISGAAIDVLSAETVKANPLINNKLQRYACRNNNLLITPHLGGATYESMRITGLYIGEKIKEIVQKELY